MKRDVALNLLHGLVNVPVQDRHRSKALQVRKRLPAVLGSPAPFWIHAPERNMRKHHDRSARLQVLDVIFEPIELFVSQRAEPSGLQVQHVHQADEMRTLLVEAVPTRALRSFAVALEIL